MKKICRYFCLILCFILLGCNSNVESSAIPPIMPAPSKMHGPTKVSILQTPTFTTPSFFATDWMIPYSQNIEKRKVVCDNGYKLEAWSAILSMSNDNWTVYTCSPYNLAAPSSIDYSSRYTKVVKTDLSQSWTISHKNFTWSNRPDSLLATYRWSQDGKYLYLMPHISGIDGFPTSAYFRDESFLYRLDLADGNFETILNGANSFSVSPDDQLLISSQADKPATIHLANLNNGDIQQISLDFDNEVTITGVFVWNTDSTKVVFASGYSNDNGDYFDDLSATSIFLLTIKDLRIQTLLHKDYRLLVPSLEFPRVGHWIDTNTISLTSLKQGNEFLNDISLNVHTGKIMNFISPTVESKITSTP